MKLDALLTETEELEAKDAVQQSATKARSFITTPKNLTQLQQELLQKLNKLFDVHECRYGLWFIDLKALDLQDSPRFRDFKILLECIDKLLKDENFFEPKNVSRTSLAVIYYYYYNELHNTLDASDTRQNFAKHLRNFKNGLDKFLELAFYQPFDTRNFFDMALAFSSYAYLNL